MPSKENEYGLQPLNGLLERLNLKNEDLVGHSKQQLTHKQVQKARKGRRVTANIKRKIILALNSCARDKRFNMTDLFNY